MRRASATDAEAVRTVNERAIRVSAQGFYTPDQIEAWAGPLRSEAATWMIDHTPVFVAVAGQRVIGFANLVEATGDVDQLYVDPDHGGRGVARALYEAVERHARSIGLRRLTTTASMRAASAFERFGFTRVEPFDRFFNGSNFAVVAMVKDLIQR